MPQPGRPHVRVHIRGRPDSAASAAEQAGTGGTDASPLHPAADPGNRNGDGGGTEAEAEAEVEAEAEAEAV